MNPQLAQILGLTPEELDQLDPATLAGAVGQSFGEGPRAGGPPDPRAQFQAYGQKQGMTPTEIGNTDAAYEKAVADLNAPTPPPARSFPAYQSAPAPAWMGQQPRRTELPPAMPGLTKTIHGGLKGASTLGGMLPPGGEIPLLGEAARAMERYDPSLTGVQQAQQPAVAQAQPGVSPSPAASTSPAVEKYMSILFPGTEFTSQQELEMAVRELGGDTGPTEPPAKPTGGEETTKGSAEAQEREARRQKLEMWRGVGGGLNQVAEGVARLGGAKVDLGTGTEAIDREIKHEEDILPITMIHKLREAGIDLPDGTTYSELKAISPALANAQRSEDRALDRELRRSTLEESLSERRKLHGRLPHADLANMDQVDGAIAEMEGLIRDKPRFDTGPIASRWHNIASWVGLQDPEKATFKQEVTTALNQRIRQLTGAVMSINETTRIANSMPQWTDNDAVFMAKARTAHRLMEEARDRFLSNRERAGFDVAEYRRTVPTAAEQGAGPGPTSTNMVPVIGPQGQKGNMSREDLEIYKDQGWQAR